jgi:hypothetical protein
MNKNLQKERIMKNGWSYYRDIDGSEVKHAPKTLVGNVYVQEAEAQGLQSLLDAKLQNEAGVIQTTHIADGAVSGAKLANESVTSGKIANDAIRNEHIPDAQISPAKIAGLASTIVTTVQDKLAQVTSGAMSENELYRQVVLAVKTAMENSEVEGTVEDALRDQIVEIVRSALNSGIETGNLSAASISARQANISQLTAENMTSDNLTVNNDENNIAVIDYLYTDNLNAVTGKLDTAAMTGLTVTELGRIADLRSTSVLADFLKTKELRLLDDSGNTCRLKVSDGGKVEAVEGGISGGAITDSSLPGSKIMEYSILADKINVVDLFANQAFIDQLKTHMIDTEDLNIIINQTNAMFDKLKMFFHFSENGLDLYQEGSAFKMHLDGDEITFKDSGAIVAAINNGQLNIQNAAVANSLALGKNKWSTEADGSLSLIWNGV